MKKEKVCKKCEVRESIAITATGEGFKKGLCKGCRIPENTEPEFGAWAVGI